MDEKICLSEAMVAEQLTHAQACLAIVQPAGVSPFFAINALIPQCCSNENECNQFPASHVVSRILANDPEEPAIKKVGRGKWNTNYSGLFRSKKVLSVVGQQRIDPWRNRGPFCRPKREDKGDGQTDQGIQSLILV